MISLLILIIGLSDFYIKNITDKINLKKCTVL